MSDQKTLHLGNLSAPRGAKKKKKRVGLGMGSGHGKTATRGHKGQKSRTGSSIRRGFEGGQMPLYRRVPKRGFTNIFKKVVVIVNLRDLNSFKAEEKITPEILAKKGLIKKANENVKILGEGEISIPLEIYAHAFSRSAQEKIQKAAGKCVVLSS